MSRGSSATPEGRTAAEREGEGERPGPRSLLFSHRREPPAPLPPTSWRGVVRRTRLGLRQRRRDERAANDELRSGLFRWFVLSTVSVSFKGQGEKVDHKGGNRSEGQQKQDDCY
ncbi:Hypothetical predicted protein [Podarcis lilfordi]|uniref:Uncharacterized protein n=1 Tax=Podarcis lilfordi TaxID=74358 RepID=A0AA35P0F9_9SAUR|nr:Hypothetical predicted protein [Podarcis lilfordi]